MRFLVARCAVTYAGRLDASLASAVRAIIVKADGSVLVHSDAGGYKPLNWMSAPCTVTSAGAPDDPVDGVAPAGTPVAPGVWRVTNRTGEVMVIEIEEVLSDASTPLGAEPGLVKDGVERQLQELLAAHLDAVRPGLRLVRREYPTPLGPLDILARADHGHVAIEVKRKAEIAGVEQVARYVEMLDRDPLLQPVSGLLVAQEFRPQARVLAAERSIGCVTVDYDELRGRPADTLTLF
jgi:RecB family endonuclease NucS